MGLQQRMMKAMMRLITGIDRQVGRLESDLILRALSEAKGNKSAAAASLGIKRTTLLDMIRRKRLGAGGVDASRPSIATSA